MKTGILRATVTISILIAPRLLAQWQQVGLDSAVVTALAVDGSCLFAGADSGTILGADVGGVFRSTNDGISWTRVNCGLTSSRVRCLVVSPDGAGGTALFVGTDGDGIFRSMNHGSNWTQADSGLTDVVISRLAVNQGDEDRTNLFAATETRGVFRSTDLGLTWVPVSEGLQNPEDATQYYSVTCFISVQKHLFAGTFGNGVFRFDEVGMSWIAVNGGPQFVNSLASIGQKLFAGGNDGVYLSTDGGESWNPFGLTAGNVSNGLHQQVTCLLACHPIGGAAIAGLLAGTGYETLGPFIDTEGHGVFFSTGNDSIWRSVGAGLFVLSLVMGPDTSGPGEGQIFAGTLGDGLWKRPLAEMVTSAETSQNDVPIEISLSQNYPNPFNPSTTIRYELPKSSMVRLSVSDLVGREVAVLVDEIKNAGTYEVRFDGSKLASGVYFYRIQAGGFTKARRLLLVK